MSARPSVTPHHAITRDTTTATASPLDLALPAGWRQERLCNVTDLRTSNVDKKSADGEQAVKLCNYVDVYYHDKIRSDIAFMDATATTAQIQNFTLRKGDVVMTKDSETPDDIGIPALVAEDIPDLVCGYHLTILRAFPDVMIGEYLFYALSSQLSAYQFYLASNGVTRFGLTYQGTKNLKIAYPEDKNRQKMIANFLDWKTEKIDALIDKKRALTKKLKEKRIALITNAVTKGITGSTLRNSGVEWIGSVPTHWQVMSMHHIVRMRSGEAIISQDIEVAGEFPVYGGNGLRGYCEKYTHDGHYVLIGRQGAHCGNINYAKGKFWASEHAVVATPDRPLDITWLGETLRAMNLNQYSESAAQPGLSVEVIGRLKMPFPPADEQADIAKFIQEETLKTDTQIIAIKRIIDRLEEYRASLITTATIGQIDVRSIQIPRVT